MRVFGRPLALAAALFVVAAVGPATAQTVYVAKAPVGVPVELALNGTTIQTATTDAMGVGPMPFTLPAGKTEIDVRVFVDICDPARKVTLVETGWQPAAAGAGCNRKELFGVFSVTSVTSLVVDAGEQSQSVWIRQGKPPANWLDPSAEVERDVSSFEFPLPTGLVVFGGAGVSKAGQFVAVSCGSQNECTVADVRFGFRAGVDFWFNRYLAASGSYLKPLKMQDAGSGAGYSYLASQISDIVTFTGKVAIPAGRVRLWAEGGGLYHRTTLVTDQTMDTMAAGSTAFAGGTQQFLLQTAGVGWIAGGGAEVWMTKKLAFFGEFTRASLTGKARAGGEGAIDDTLTSAVAGLKFRFSR